MSDFNTRGKLPFTVVSSSVNTGYAAELTASVGYNIDIVNKHKDEYGQVKDAPAQGPFTNQHVGGNQHRHQPINTGNDDATSRGEAYIISSSAGSVKVYGPDINGLDKPRSLLTRDNTAKSPVNIKNIQTSGNVAGNFENNYQVVQTVGRRTTNNLINDGFEASGSLTTKFVSGSHEIYSLPDITNNSKSIFVERFNAPGGKEESSRGALDREGEEYAPNNSLVTRNIKVRQPYYNQLTKYNTKTYVDQYGNKGFFELKLDSFLFSDSKSIVTEDTSPRGFYFKKDGTEFFMIGQTHDKVHRYQMSSPFKISTSTVVSDISISAQTGTPRGLTFTDDGLYMFVVGSTNIYKYQLSSPWDITTITFDSSHNLTVSPTAVFFDPTGTKLFIAITTGFSSIKQYSLSSPWNITAPVLVRTFDVSDQVSLVTGIYFDGSGTELVICSETGEGLIEYKLANSYDLDSFSYSQKIKIEQESRLHDVFITEEKNKIFLLGTQFDNIYEYTINYETSHSVNRNTREKVEFSGSSVTTGSKHDNFWVQHAIPSTDLRYKWIAESVTSSQQPIEYQSYNLPYSTGSSYNANGAFSDIEFTQTGPFGDHLGISGAIDKDEMHVSTYTNTMYRDRKYFKVTVANQFSIDFSNIASEISKKDFTLSTWISIPSNVTDIGPFPIISYSGSEGRNRIVFRYEKGGTDLFVPTLMYNSNFIESDNSNGYLTKQIKGEYNDGKWHLLTLVNSFSQIAKQTESGSILRDTITKIYLDAGLVCEAKQEKFEIDITSLKIEPRSAPLENMLIDDILIWTSALSERQIVHVFNQSKSKYGNRSKKYYTYKLDNSIVTYPKYAYSLKIEEVDSLLIDENNLKNASLLNFTSSVNTSPQNSGIISYSTYFNGPYEGASWKSIRNNEHPVTRKLTTENTNIVSTLIPEGTKKVTRVVRGIPVTFQLPGSRKQGKLLNVKECPVYINNKPLKHRFILKDSVNQDIATEVIHTYGNNLQYFANQELNDTLGLAKTDRQMYDLLRDYYTGETEEIENPIQKLVGFTYSETIYPKNGQGLLKASRQRTDYITDQPGYSIDGYDRQLGTQRVFWRDNQEDRMRNRRAYITSLGDKIESIYDLPFQTPSVAALEYISESSNINYASIIPAGKEQILDISYKNCAELNISQNYIITNYRAGILQSYSSWLRPVSQVPEYYFFKDIFLTTRHDDNIIIKSGLYPRADAADPSSVRVLPKYVFDHCYFMRTASVDGEDTSKLVYEQFTHDLGMNRLTEKISGKNPWYDSYEEYYVDIKNLSNDKLVSYSKIPEFIISNHISSLIGEYGGDATKITIDEYTDNLQFTYKKSIDRENKDICEEDTINIVVDGIKKLLPYNGFYPQDRSIQLVNYLKESWLDTNAIGGGLYLTSSTEGEHIFREDNDKLVQFLKESVFLEPLYSPGIFYNLIKSGIAVDWSVYTGSLPTDSYLIPLAEKPQFRISFESLINLYNIPLSSSSDTLENRIMKYKETSAELLAGDYLPGGKPEHRGSFQGFFEKLKEGSPLYTLSISNFLAETINFFLKDSSLNTFISKPDSDFAILDSSKTYYMDVVLRKNDIVMCEAHSSSLADSFGKMSGRYFGPSFWTGSVADQTNIENELILAQTLRDPGYCAFAPPYYYGDSVARISFKPDTTRKYSLDEIFSDMQIENFNTSFINNSVYPSGSLYSSFVMPIESSVTIKGEIEQREQTVDIASRNTVLANTVKRNLQNLVGTATSQTGIKRWVISPKMETPVLDFSNQEFITSTTILTQSYVDEQLKLFEPLHTPPTASGFGRGMWSGYGEIPEGEKGIFLELRESHPRQLIGVLNPITRQFVETNTGSLLQACGFQQTNDKLSQRIGELADTREISEAIVIIPYLDRTSTGKTIRFGGGFSTLTVNDTVEIEGHNFIKINQNIFNYQKTNVLANKPAVDLADFSVGNTKIQETSISRMLELMSKYVLPPNFDFLLNNDVTPFVMYIAEFTSTLDKQDLADIWQGVMPKIATRAEWEKQVISHKNTQFDFFHGQGLPQDVKFMIFKAKKRAEINYYKMTADAKDDKLFPSIQAGKPPSPYSFNWPYDYCSLVETARVDVEIEYINKSGSNNT